MSSPASVPESDEIWSREELRRRVHVAAARPGLQPDLNADLARQLRLRLAAGRSLFAPQPEPGIAQKLLGNATRLATGALFAVLIMVVAFSPSGFAIVVLVGVTALYLVTIWAIRTGEFRSDFARTRHVRCAQCAYSVVGLPRPAVLEGADSPLDGPETCPECGLLWPLLPRLRSEQRN